MIGKSLGHYEVLAPLGAGAMGEVYRALDTNLKRNVAVKVLPEDLVEDPDRLARLRREAQLLAAVNHPNIAAIYNLEEAAGRRFLVLELIEGESLADLLADALPFEDALRLCGQVAEALEAAHRAGIIHRDLKPANIMVTPEGRAKVLDFGIAKAVDSGAGAAETARLTDLTGTGMIVGTAPYMSPEQVRDQPLDKRTDIWAFGCVLYETLAGKRAFERETVGDTLCAILEHEPDWSALPASTPTAVGPLLRRCLQKDPQLRLRDIGDAWVEINEVLASYPRSRPTQPTTGRFLSRIGTRRIGNLAVTAALLAIAAVAAAGVMSWVGSSDTEPMLMSASAPTHRQITFTGQATDAAISPDGASVVYVTGKRGSGQRLMLADVAGGPAVEILAGLSVFKPEWSPDGSRLTVSAHSDQPTPVRVYLLRRLGGNPRHLGKGLHSTWSPDGSRIAFNLQAPTGFWVFSESTGESVFTALDGYDFNHGVSWSHGGDRVAVLGETTATGVFEIFTVDPNGGNRRTIVALTDRLSSPRWAPGDSTIYFLRHAGNLGEVLKVDISSMGDPVGEPAVVLSGLQPGDTFNLSADGRALIYSTDLQTSNLWLAELTGEGADGDPNIRQLTMGTSSIEWPSFSPDGQWIAYAAQTSNGANIFRMPAHGGDPVQLTFSDDYQTSPAWSPDGSSIAFSQRDADGASIWTMGADGTRSQRLPQTRVSTDEMRVTWAPGRLPLYEASDNRNLSLLEVDTGAELPLVTDEERGWVFSPQYSPEGSQVALYWNRPPHGWVWLVTLEPYTERVVAETPVDPIGWSPDGTWIYVVRTRGDYVGRVPATGGDLEVLFRLPGDVYRGSVDSTGTRIAVPVGAAQADVFLVENFDPTLR